MRQVPMLATGPAHDLARVDIERVFLWGQGVWLFRHTSLLGEEPHTPRHRPCCDVPRAFRQAYAPS